MTKVWERRSHAFPPHYTPDCKILTNVTQANLGKIQVDRESANLLCVMRAHHTMRNA